MNFIRQTVYAFMLLYSCVLTAADTQQIDIASFTDQEKQELLLHMFLRTDTGEFLLFFNEQELEQITHPDGEFAYLCKSIYQKIYRDVQTSLADQQLQRASDYATFDTLLSCHTLKAVFDIHLSHETSEKFNAILSEALSATICRDDVSGQTAENIINALQRVELIYRLQQELKIPMITQGELFDQLYTHNIQYNPSVHIMYKNKVAALMQQFAPKVQPDVQAIEVFKKASRDTCRNVLANPSQLSIG